MTPSFHAVVLTERNTAHLLVVGVTAADRTRRALAQVDLHLSRKSGSGPVVLLLAADALLEPAAITALVAGAAKGTATLAAGDDPARPAALALSLRDTPAQGLTTERLSEVVATLRAEGRLQQVATGDALCLRVSDSVSAERASTVLLARLIRPRNGSFARNFDRHLSRPVSVRLVELGVPPNGVTAVATLIGLTGAGLLAQMSQGMRVLGAGLFVVSTILDGCGGEVAQLALRRSGFGRLDLIGGDIVNAAVFLGLAIALARGADGGIPAVVIYLTGGGFVLARFVGVLFSNWLARTERHLDHDWYERLTGHDFAYVILALAIAGRLHWFLWMAVIGCYVFVAAVLIYWARLRRAARLGS